jgi:hypothetical protein
MQVIIIFTVVGSVLFIGAYYLLVRRYYWGDKRTKEKIEDDERERQAKERDA